MNLSSIISGIILTKGAFSAFLPLSGNTESSGVFSGFSLIPSAGSLIHQLLGKGSSQDAEKIVIQKSSFPKLKASDHNSAQSLLVGLLLRLKESNFPEIEIQEDFFLSKSVKRKILTIQFLTQLQITEDGEIL